MSSLIWSYVEPWWPVALSVGVVLAGIIAALFGWRYGRLAVAALGAGLGAIVGIAWERIRQESGPPQYKKPRRK